MERDYYMRLDLNTTSKLDIETANLAYRTLKKAQMPLFSGAIDHRINLFAEREIPIDVFSDQLVIQQRA